MNTWAHDYKPMPKPSYVPKVQAHYDTPVSNKTTEENTQN
jgi:hypothetical protein